MVFFCCVAALTLSVDVFKEKHILVPLLRAQWLHLATNSATSFHGQIFATTGANPTHPCILCVVLSDARCLTQARFFREENELKCHMIALMGASKITANAIQVVGHQHIFHSRQC